MHPNALPDPASEPSRGYEHAELSVRIGETMNDMLVFKKERSEER